MGIYKEDDVSIVVLQKPSSGGGGKGGSPAPENVIVEEVGEPEESPESPESPEKPGKDGEGKDGEGKDGEGKDGEGKGEGKPGDGKGGKSGQAKDIEQILKRVRDAIEDMKAVDPTHCSCGSVNEREKKKDKAISEGKDKDVISEKEKIKRQEIIDAFEEAARNGNPLPSDPVSRSRGEGKGGSAPKGNLIPMQVRPPEFLEKMQDFAKSEYRKVRTKKDTDWLYTQAYDNITFKDRPKVSVPRKAIYILVDVSGSMFSDFDGRGNSLLDHLVGYLPVMAEEFVGQVWWMSDGILHWSRKPKEMSDEKWNEKNAKGEYTSREAITELSVFKDMDAYDATMYLKEVQDAEGAGSGTTFNHELQLIQALREEGKNNAPIICLTDSVIDTVITRYTWPVGSDDENDKVDGKLPPNTYFMTDPNGISYMKSRGYVEDEDPIPDYFNYEKNIQYYDVTEGGKYKTKNNR